MVNWSIAQQPSAFDRAFQGGFQQGEYIRQRQEQTAQRNALAGYATNPNEQTFNALAQAAPEYAIQVRGQRDQQAQEARAQQMRQQAAQGDPQALAELAGVDLNAWRGLNSDQQRRLGETATVLGNVAMQIGTLPEEQRAAAWDAQVDQLSQRFPEIASERGQYSPENLAATINEAGMFQQFYQSQQPDYMAIPEGGTLVNTRDPAAISQFGQGQQSPAQQPVARNIGDATYYQNPSTGEWFDNPQEAAGTQMNAPQMTVTPQELDALVRRYGPQEVQRRLDSGIVAVRGN